MTTRPTIGGFHRDPRVPQLGLFIRDSLTGGRVTWAHQLWEEYKNAVEAIPKRRGKGKRKVISYEGFRRYLAGFRTLGLIEYVIDPETGLIDGDMPDLTGGQLNMPRNYFRLVPGAEGDPRWQNLWDALS